MGSSASIQNIEVSFVDNKTGKLLPNKQILEIIDNVSFEFKCGFYDKYKNNSSYDIYKKWLEEKKN